MHVTVRAATNGVPGAILGETTLGTATSGLNNLITFTNSIQQVAGQQYAIVVDYPPGPGAGLWNGSTQNPYAGGTLVADSGGGSWIIEPNYDLQFRTYVVPP